MIAEPLLRRKAEPDSLASSRASCPACPLPGMRPGQVPQKVPRRTGRGNGEGVVSATIS